MTGDSSCWTDLEIEKARLIILHSHANAGLTMPVHQNVQQLSTTERRLLPAGVRINLLLNYSTIWKSSSFVFLNQHLLDIFRDEAKPGAATKFSPSCEEEILDHRRPCKTRVIAYSAMFGITMSLLTAVSSIPLRVTLQRLLWQHPE